MKKLVLAILAVGSIATAQAQSGSILVYGNVGFSSMKETNDDGIPGTPDIITKERTWEFAPGVGYQFNKHWTVGINFGIAGTKQINETDDATPDPESTTRDLMVGPFVRMTMPINKIFSVYHQVNVSYLNGKTIYDDDVNGTPDVENTYNGFGANWFPAVGVNFTRCMALNFSFGGLGYAQRTWDNDGPSETKESGFIFNFGRQFNIGISANLGGHHKHMKGHHEPGEDRRRHMDMSDDDDAPKKKSTDDDEE